MKTKSLPKTLLALCALVFALFGIVKPANAVIHELPIGNNTVYFSITDNTNHYVEYVYPNQNNVSWDGYTKPTGSLDLLGTFEYMGVTYTATSIGNWAFNGCSGLYAVTIPSTITHIASGAFGGTSLIQVNIYSNAIASDTYTSTYTLSSLFGGGVQGYAFGQGVTAIGPCAFYGCEFLETVNIPNSVTTIGYSAFESCTSLESIVLPNSLTTIPNAAFRYCSNLQQITIPASVTSIANFAFQFCDNLHRINITDVAAWCGIYHEISATLPFDAYYDLYLNGAKLTNLTIPSSVTSINENAFFNCSSLTQLTIPSSVTSIGDAAFAYCSSLTQVTFSSSVPSIESGAFNGCTNLTRVNISSLDVWCMTNFGSADSNPLTYAHHLYVNNSKVTNLNNLSSATRVGSYAFSGCTDFTALTISGSVTSIGNSAFNNCSNMTSVTIPSSVTSIGSGAFNNCSNMTSVTIPSSVTSIGSSAFSGCNGLTRVDISNLTAWCGISFGNASANPLYYAHHLYHNGNLVTNLNLGSSTSIGDYAFVGCLDFVSSPNLTSSSIGSYAFSGCTSITSVTIPIVVQSVGNYAFSGCTSLTSVTINSNAVASAEYSGSTSSYNNFRSRFGNQVTSYTFGPYVTSIGTYALYNCTGMTELTFQGPVSSVGNFYGCSGLTRVEVSNLDAWCGISFNNSSSNPLYYAHHLYHNNNLVTSLDNLGSPASVGSYAFYGCTDLTSVTIPSSVQSLGNYAFEGCTSLTSVTINSNAVASAGYSNYNNFKSRFGYQVTSYTIGPEVTAIGANAFYNCTSITELTVCAMTPPTITTNTFTGVSTSIPVYVPIGTVAAYQAAQYWSRFTNFIGSASVNTSVVALPYEQPFDDNNAPEGWNAYTGWLNWSYSSSTYTNVTLTPQANAWDFGQPNGVFDSHAFTMLGNTSNECKWLISPTIILGDANNVFLSFDLAMSRWAGTQIPLTPEAQNNQYISVLVTNDGGVTWHELGAWRHEPGFYDLDALSPEGYTYHFNLSAYQNQNIQVAFYAECTDSNDNNNRVHIDNVNVQSHDVTGAPTSVTVSEVAGHSAKVSWTAASPMQYHWDLWLPYSSNPNYINNCTPEYMQENGYYYQHLDGYYQHIVTGLEPNESYQAWVRYNDGTTTSDWVASNVFNTESLCADPTNLQVEVTQHTALVTWDPGQSNQTSWDTFGGTDDMDGETVYEPFRLLTGLEPGEEYSINVIGICEDGDGNSVGISTTFTTLSLPTLTVNDGHSQDNDIVPITAYSLPDSESETQFIIPASQLIDMQYSDIRQISFYEGWYRNCAPWGADVWFKVRIMEVPEANYNNAQYPEDQFYGYNNNPDFETLYHGRLSLDNEGKMNISFGDHPFHYENGNLLIGVKQDADDVGTDYQADWLGIHTQDWSSMYVPAGSDPTTEQFLPKVTFTYEPDDYLPPTDFEAYVTGAYEVTFSWTPREGQTATEIMVCGSPDFVGNQFLTNSTNDHCTIVKPDFFEPEETYYYRYHGVYNVDGENHYSAWSAVGSFTMPDACEPPANLTVSDVGPFSAHFEWVSGAEYSDLEYREREDQYQYTTVLSENFESSDLPLGWRTAQGTGTSGSGWTVFYQTSGTNSYAYQGRGCIVSGSNTTGSNVRIDDWVIIPVNNLHGKLNFYAKLVGNLQTTLKVLVSTSGYATSNFSEVASITPGTTYALNTIDLTQYSGSGYIAIRHIRARVTSQLAVAVDNLKFRVQTVVPTYGDWISAGSTEENQIDLFDLTPGTDYEARVRAICETGFSSEWGTTVSFSTPGNIVFEDPIVKVACVYAWDTNGDGELSYAEAAAVTDLSFVFNNDPTITSFNELQYFTGLTAIGNDAFAGCANLGAITLPNTITSIDSYAFGSCSSLQSIVIPPSVTTIAGAAFNNCGLTEIDLPYSVTTIGTLAFGDCNSLVSVYIPASVTTISNGNSNAFTGAALANIEVDAGNPVYDSRDGCNAIIETATNKLITGCQNTIIPYGVTSIGNSAFEDCSNLTDITLPATVDTLGDYAFLNCTSLNTIEVNASTPPTMNTTEANHTFKNLDISNISVYVPCGSLETYQDSDWNGFDLFENCNIVFEDMLTKQICVEAWDRNFDGELSYREAAAVTSLNNEFYESNITSFNELQYFTGLDMIYEDDFVDCQQLVAVTLPPTVTTIDASAFTNCVSLASITFGENITDIGGYAFYGCTGLAFIKVEAQNPPTMGYNTFYGVPSSIPVYVPCGTKEEYEGDLDWSYFFNNFIDPCATVTQTLDLVEGYNWVSLYVEVEDPMEMLVQLETALGDRGITIDADGIGTENFGDGEWFGDLDFEGVYNEQMYLIQVSEDCTIELEGAPIDPSVHEIYIHAGYNWIGFPYAEELDINVAFSGFEAEDEDYIETPEGISYYFGEWMGDIMTLVPGQGYMYFSNSEDVKTLVILTGAKARRLGSSNGVLKSQRKKDIKPVGKKHDKE